MCITYKRFVLNCWYLYIIWRKFSQKNLWMRDGAEHTIEIFHFWSDLKEKRRTEMNEQYISIEWKRRREKRNEQKPNWSKLAAVNTKKMCFLWFQKAFSFAFPFSLSLSTHVTNAILFSFIFCPVLFTRFIDKLRWCFSFQPNVAPEGYQIKLDFRNRFNIEPSATCEYDFLEVKTEKLSNFIHLLAHSHILSIRSFTLLSSVINQVDVCWCEFLHLMYIL